MAKSSNYNNNNCARVRRLLLVVSVSFCFQNGSGVQHPSTDSHGLSACLQPKFVGPCRARVPKYYYSTVSKKCELFFYGGCEQNSNNFDTFEECSSVCTEKILRQTKEATCTGPAQAVRHHCMAMIQRWTFNTTTKRCEQIVYGGCGATLNNFVSEHDCQLKCVDNSSSLSKSKEPWSKYMGSNCEGVKCPGGTSHYKALGCTQIYDDGACCPTRFDCPDRTVQRNSSQCVYDGKLYNVGEAISAADSGSGCRAGCACTMHGINCAYVECPSNFGYYPKKDCKIELYKPGQCCAHDFACGNETVTCQFEGKSYFEGQKIYPKDEPCLKCYCKPGFNGTLTTEFCEEIDCGIQVFYSTELERGCTPVYYQDSESRIGCCPISWQCPEDHEPKLATNETQIEPQPAFFAPFAPDPVLTVPDSWQNNNNNNTITTNNSTVEDNIQVDIQNKTVDTPTQHALPIILENVCSLPKAPGNCRARRRRYFYNNETSQCEEFFYTGCEGNRNNFQLLADCNAECGAENDLQARFRTIRKPGRAERYTDPCTQMVSPGRCRAYFPRFYYDVVSGSCQFFIFGGCHRNDNNFYSKESCEATCLTSYPNICDKKPLDLDKDCGSGNSTKFYYDADVGYCKRFVSSGCGGSNVFNRQIECDSACQGGGGNSNRGVTTNWRTAAIGERDKICMLPKKVGSCYASVPSFYYDVASGSCQPFVYGGCFGNRNRFTSEYECRQTCETPTPTTTVVARDRDLTSISFNERPSAGGLPQQQPSVPINHNINQRPQGVDLTVLLAAAGDNVNQQPPQVEDPTLMRRGGDATTSAGTTTTTTTTTRSIQKQHAEEEFIFARMGKTHQHPQIVDDSSLTSQKPQTGTRPVVHHHSNEEANSEDSFYKPQVEDPSLMLQHKDEDEDDFNQQQFKENFSPFSDDNPWANFTDTFDDQQLQPGLNFTPSFDQEVEPINPWANFTPYFDNQPHPWLNFTPHFDHQQLKTPSNPNQRPQIQPPRNPSTSQQPPRDNRRREVCLENLSIGNCSQTILRFYWDGRSCRPFNYTGCEGNRNQFTTEYECKQTCDENYHDVSSNLYCQFGRRVIPFGQNLDDNEGECDTDFCTCIVPPSLTCTMKACPQQ